MLNNFIIEGNIKKYEMNEDGQLCVTLEVKREDENSEIDIIEVYLNGSVTYVSFKYCSRGDAIIVNGHIESNDILQYRFFVDKMTCKI